MKFLDSIRAKKREKEMKKVQHRREYLLNKSTPFNILEAFRNLKATLSVSIPGQKGMGRAIAFTSSYPEDGKTTVTTNLALMFAVSETKVVLIDADIRKGRVAKYFRAKSTPGLSDYLSGLATIEEIVRPSNVNPNLFYIACGTHSPKPYELLESEKMQTLIDELKKQFNYVVIDTPPVLLVSDALAVASKTDGTVVVCRQNLSYISDVQRSISSLQFAKANVLGVVVNDSATSHKSYGGYKNFYGSSGYQYASYAYSYGTTEPDTEEETETETTNE